jgi:solute:Na+ symporter, SSS family
LWRVNAWCEVVAMISSFAVSVAILLLNRAGHGVSTDAALLITVATTTICWVATAFIGPQTDQRVLIEFYRKVRPFGPGWRAIRTASGVTETQARERHENIPLSLLGWAVGCTVIWSGLFMVGNFLYGRTGAALLLLGTFVVSGTALVVIINRLWWNTDRATTLDASGPEALVRN